MSLRLSKLFGMDIYSVDGEYKGKVFDLIINLEKGKVETITTEALRPKTKQEAKRILSEKSIPYKKVKSAKDINIRKFEESVEIKAYAGKKGYFKVIPTLPNTKIVDKKFQDEMLKIVVG